MIEDHPFKPGTEVWIVRYNQYSPGVYSAEKTTVNKLHKTGRFTVNGRGGQFTASRQYGGDGWEAFCAGSRSGERVEIMTPRLAEVIAAGKRSRRALDAIATLERVRRSDFAEADVAALEDIVARNTK